MARLVVLAEPHDFDFVDKLTLMLAPVRDRLDLWTPRDVRPGDPYDATLKAQAASAQILVPLVSKYFLADVPLMRLVDTYQGQTPLAWILLSSCMWQLTFFNRHQGLNQAKALRELPEQQLDAGLSQISEHLMGLVQPAVKAPAAQPGPAPPAQGALEMQCQNCEKVYPYHLLFCPKCAEANPVKPNVFLAERERQALQTRYLQACSEANQRNATQVLEHFAARCQTSRAVLNRSPEDVLQLISNERNLYKNWYELRDSGARLPENNKWDQWRQMADNLFFTHFADDIYFLCLSLDGNGLWHYGDCTLVLSERPIQKRVSLFEENTAVWYLQNYRPGEEPPQGLRAVWEERHKLCVAKYAAQIQGDTPEQNFAEILLAQGRDGAGDVFIEVHLYQSFGHEVIAEVRIPEALSQELMATLLREKLAGLQIPLEVVPCKAS